MATPRRARREETTIWWWIRSCCSYLLLFTVIGLLGIMIILPRATGSTAYTVLTGSMRPGYPPGTLIVVRPTNPEHLGIGTVITYQLKSGEPAVVTHRIVSLGFTASGERTFITQGDANGAVDERVVRAVQVRGKLWYSVPYLGYLNSWLTGRARSIVLTVVVAGLLTYAAAMFIGAARERWEARQSRSREAAAKGTQA